MGKKKASAKAVLQNVKKVLEAADLMPDPLEDEPGYLVVFGEDDPAPSGVAHVIAEDARFAFILEFGRKAPADRRGAVAEFVCRANWGMAVGNFEFDFDDGEVRFRVGIEYGTEELSPQMISNAVLCAMDAVEHYAPALLAVMDGKGPSEAIAEVESEGEAEDED
jgi:hypothetical protein